MQQRTRATRTALSTGRLVQADSPSCQRARCQRIPLPASANDPVGRTVAFRNWVTALMAAEQMLKLVNSRSRVSAEAHARNGGIKGGCGGGRGAGGRCGDEAGGGPAQCPRPGWRPRTCTTRSGRATRWSGPAARAGPCPGRRPATRWGWGSRAPAACAPRTPLSTARAAVHPAHLRSVAMQGCSGRHAGCSAHSINTLRPF